MIARVLLKYSGGMMSMNMYQITEFTHIMKNWKMNIARPMTTAVIVAGEVSQNGCAHSESRPPNLCVKAKRTRPRTTGGIETTMKGILRPHLLR